MRTNLVLAGLSVVVFAGCATSNKRGHVVMKTSDSEAHVTMGSGEVNVGDHVELYHNQCEPNGDGEKGTTSKSCQKVIGGHGEVTNVFNGDYSTVRFPPGTKFSVGDTIEKHVH